MGEFKLKRIEGNGHSDKVGMYSPLFNGEEYSEFEKFILQFQQSRPKDMDVILYRISKILADGLDDRHFRYEATKRDRVAGLPSHLETSSLRLYCLKILPDILIVGGGGVKTTRTYNEDPNLTELIKTLIQIDSVIRKEEKCGTFKSKNGVITECNLL